MKDSEIYCRRAKEMHTASSHPSKSGLFMYSMESTRLHLMFDPSIVGQENLVAHMKDVDSFRWEWSGLEQTTRMYSLKLFHWEASRNCTSLVPRPQIRAMHGLGMGLVLYCRLLLPVVHAFF